MKFNYLIITLIFGLFSCNKSNELYKIEGNVFGSSFMIKYYGTEDYQKSFDSIFTEINYSLSTYDKNSTISKWNNSDGKNLKIDNHISFLVKKSLYINNISDGFYDPTVASLVNFYGFGAEKMSKTPSDKQLDSLLNITGLSKIKLSERLLIKNYPQIKIDFNSIAPGYTADLIGEFLKSKKVENFLIDIGGEILSKGKKGDSFWSVGIEDPTHSIDDRTAIKSVYLKDKSLATSGNYRKTKLNNKGERISHTINPKTGKAEVTNLLSASIITSTAADADGIATACMAMGLEKSKLMLKNHKEYSAFFIYQEQGKLQTLSINNFESNFIQ